MKKFISVCLVLMITLPLVFCFVGCSNLNDFPNLSGFIANVTDATGVGISSVSQPSTSARLNGGIFADATAERDNTQPSVSEEGKNYALVGNESGFEQLSFTKIIPEDSGEVVEGTTRVIASSDKDSFVEVVSSTAYSVTINVDHSREYRAVDTNGDVLTEWNKFDEDTHKFTFSTEKTVKIESRSLEANISFNLVDGFEYSVFFNGESILEGLRDNDEHDTNSAKGAAKWGHFTEGETYEVRYKGHGRKEKFFQDDLKADIDKLYTVNGFTFISFVPKGKSNRPTAEDTLFCEDGVDSYDKVGYYTDNMRKSFVIDNATGYVYPLANFHVRLIAGGLLFSDENKQDVSGGCDLSYVYDFKTTENGDLNIYQLFSNTKDKFIWDCAKDKYGHKFIVGPFEDGYDSATDTYYYASKQIFLLSDGSVMMDSKIVTEDGSLRKLNENDNFKVYSPMYALRACKYIIMNGTLLEIVQDMGGYQDLHMEFVATHFYKDSRSDNFENALKFNSTVVFSGYTDIRNLSDRNKFHDGISSLLSSNDIYADHSYSSLKFLIDYDTVLMVANGQLLRFNNVLEFLVRGNNSGKCDFEVLYSGKLTLAQNDSGECELVDDGYNGKKIYDVAVEYTADNQVNFRLVEKGSFTGTPRTVTLQPINR